MVKPYHIKAVQFRSSRCQMIYKLGFLEKFPKINRKTSMVESLLNKVLSLKRFHQKKCFPMILRNFQENLII